MKEMDVVKNIKTIEWLKSELLTSLANLYEILAKNDNIDINDELLDINSNIILMTFLLSKRLGLNYEDLNSSLIDKIRLNLVEDHKIEQWYGDLSKLLEFIRHN